MSTHSHPLGCKARELITAIENPLAAVMADVQNVMPISRGDPDLPTPPHIVQAAKQALDEGYTPYTPVRGLAELRRAIAQKLARENGVEVDPVSEVIVTSGAQEAVFATMQALLQPGDEFLLPDPCYTAYNLAVMMSGGQAVPVPTLERDGFLLRPGEIAKRITPRTKGLLVVNPNMPAAGVFPLETLEEIARLVREHNLLVISDELYEKFVFDGAKHVSLASLPDMRERTITIGGVSKTYSMTGWRVGYVAGPPHIIEGLEAVKQAISICATAVSQKAALAALEGPQDCVDEARETYGQRRRFLMTCLDEMGITYGRWQGGFSVLANIASTGLTSLEFATRLLQEMEVYASPGEAFGPSGQGYVRISFLSPLPQLKEGMDRFSKVWDRCR
jgi:aminotransferase